MRKTKRLTKNATGPAVEEERGQTQQTSICPRGERSNMQGAWGNAQERTTKKKNKNMHVVKTLMELTYPYRREIILTMPVSIPQKMERFPALQLVSEVCYITVLTCGLKLSMISLIPFPKKYFKPKSNFCLSLIWILTCMICELTKQLVHNLNMLKFDHK